MFQICIRAFQASPSRTHVLIHVFPTFLKCVPTVNRSCVSHLNCVILKSAARAAASLLFHASSNFLASARTCSRSCGSGVFICWVKVGVAKLITNPTRASSDIRISLFPSCGLG